MNKRIVIFTVVLLLGTSIFFLTSGVVGKAKEDPYNQPGVIITQFPIYGTLTHFLEPTVTLSGAIVQPIISDGGLRPGIVLCHGWAGTKEELLFLASDLARAGMVVIIFDMEAMGRSTGAHNLVGGRTRLDAWAAVEYLVKYSDIFRVNTSCIGMAGHSQGGITTAIAAALDGTDGPASKGIANISASVSIFTDAYIEDLLGVMLGYDCRVLPIAWPYLGMPLFDYNNPLERWGQSVVPNINSSTPRNWMLITGQSDELTNNWIQYYVMKHAVPENITYEDLISNITYKNVWTLPTNLGNFSDGTARKFSLLLGRTHSTELHSILTATMIIDWFYDSFSFNQQRSDLDILLGILFFRADVPDFEVSSILDSIIEIIQSNGTFVGIILLMIPLMFVLSKILKNKKSTDPINAKNMEKKSFIKQLLLYAGVYIIASLFSFIFAWLFSIQTIVPFFITNLFAVSFLMKQIILAPAIFGIMWYERKKYNERAEDFGISPKSFRNSALIGMIMVFTFIFTMDLVDLTFNNFNLAYFLPPYHLTGFFTLLLIFGLNFFIDDLIFRGLVQSKMERFGNRWKAAFISNFYTTIIGGFAMMINIIPLFWNNLGAAITIWDPDLLRSFMMSSPLVLPIVPTAFLAGVGFYALIGIISALFRAKTRNIIAGTIVISLLAALIMVNFGPFGIVTASDGVFLRGYFPKI